MSGNVVVDDLGRLEGEVLVFGGCYSNLPATRALFAEARSRNIAPKNVICTGDVVAYCADPAAVVDEVLASGCSVIAGNVERQIAAGQDACGCGFELGSGCDLRSARWYPFAAARIDAAKRGWMEALPDFSCFMHEHKRYLVVHGAVSDIARFVWPTSDTSLFEAEFELAESIVGPVNGIISGHCGLAFERVIRDRHWINAGVIGMPPHDGRQMTRFVVLGPHGARIERLSYDAVAASRAMEQAGLTQGYDRSLITGLWPSEEILPSQMRRV